MNADQAGNSTGSQHLPDDRVRFVVGAQAVRLRVEAVERTDPVVRGAMDVDLLAGPSRHRVGERLEVGMGRGVEVDRDVHVVEALVAHDAGLVGDRVLVVVREEVDHRRVALGPQAADLLGGREPGGRDLVGDAPEVVAVSDAHDAIPRRRVTRGSGAEGNRTPDPFHAMEVLYQLSYSPEGRPRYQRRVATISARYARPPHDRARAAPLPDAPPFRYNAALANEIEAKWQDRWDAEHTFWAPNPTGALADGFAAVADRRKLFVLDMFPYPSGAGLHVGHPLGYIGTDVFARFMRMTGHNVLHAMGYDAFGLPAEQYAVQTGQHPRVTTEANIANMRRQLRALGLGHDPRRGRRHHRRRLLPLDAVDLPADLRLLVRRRRRTGPGRSPSCVAEFEDGARDPESDANPDALPWRELDGRHAARGRRLVPPRVPRRSAGQLVSRRSAPCSPTKRSPPTAAASAATTRCSGARSSSGCCASPPTPTGCSPTSTCSTGPSRSS